MHIEQLVAWGKDDLLSAYEVMRLVLHWQERIGVRWIEAAGELAAVAVRLEYGPPHCPAMLRSYYYAAKHTAALEEALAALPPEGECTVCAPDTDAHQRLLELPVVRAPDEVFCKYAGAAPAPPGREVTQLSAAEAIAIGLTEPWHWPSILGKQPAERPIHCILDEGRAIAVASAGCVTPLTEEVRGVWVESERRRQGFGRNVVASVTRGILARGRIPIYTHSAENIASQRLAESVGYARRGALLRLAHGGGEG